MPTTDILTPLTGEVEKILPTDPSDTAEVSFLSVITTENASVDALAAVLNLPQAPQTHLKAPTDFVGLASSLTAFIPVSESVTSPQISQPISTKLDVVNSSIPIEPSAAITDDGADTRLALPVDSRQITNAALFRSNPVLYDAVRQNQSVVPKPAASTPDLTQVTSEAADEPLIQKDGTAAAAPRTEHSPAIGNLLGTQATNDLEVSQYNLVSATRVQKSAQMALVEQKSPARVSSTAPPNAATIDARQPEKSIVFSGRPQPAVIVDNQSGKPHKTPVITQQTPIVSQTRAVSAEPMPPQPHPTAKEAVVGRPTTPDFPTTQQPPTAPKQNLVSRPDRVPSDGATMKSAIFDSPVKAKQAGLTAEASLSSGSAPSQVAAGANTRSEMPIVKTKAIVQEPKTEAKQAPKQRVETVQIHSAQAHAPQHTPADLAPQAPLVPSAEKLTAKPSRQSSTVQHTRTPIKSNNAQAAQSTDAAAMTLQAPTLETSAATILEPLSTPELMPFDVKGTDSIVTPRFDATVNRPEVMRHVAQQLADVARQMPDRPVELALNPEELGRVRLTFTATDNGIHIAVMAERGETMDLLRRHIETLAQEFREMGYKDVNFEFSQQGQNEAQDEDADAQNSAEPDAGPAQTQTLSPIQLSLEPPTGLDLRL